jgi:UDP-N-acetylglucosamine diphosphorylase/glucosamine-1-phosphate N-acetyltransferase
MPTLILFEDEGAGRFEPVALTRSVARLRLGLWTHRERWQRMFSGRTTAVVCRGYLAGTERACGEWIAVNEPPSDEDVLFVAAALGRPALEVEAAVRELEPGAALVSGGRLLAARAGGDAAVAVAAALGEACGEDPYPAAAPDWPRVLEAAGLAVRDAPDASFPATLVDLVADGAEALRSDIGVLVEAEPPPDPAAHPGVHFVEPARIRLGAGARVDPGTVLDARDGAIALGPGTHVMAGCTVCGPVGTGSGCIVKPAARLLEGVSLGPVCKIGGEVDATIVQGWSNKQHDGFLGHSYLGCWVNLGAATDTSDLKNDYGPVRIVLAGKPTETGRTSVGSLVGDHTKTAIHTRLNTGTVIGVSANVLGSDFPDKEIPSFTWGGGATREEYRVGKAVRVAAAVMARRGVELGPEDEWLLTRIHQATEPRRRRWLEGDGAPHP